MSMALVALTLGSDGSGLGLFAKAECDTVWDCLRRYFKGRLHRWRRVLLWKLTRSRETGEPGTSLVDMLVMALHTFDTNMCMRLIHLITLGLVPNYTVLCRTPILRLSPVQRELRPYTRLLCRCYA